MACNACSIYYTRKLRTLFQPAFNLHDKDLCSMQVNVRFLLSASNCAYAWSKSIMLQYSPLSSWKKIRSILGKALFSTLFNFILKFRLLFCIQIRYNKGSPSPIFSYSLSFCIGLLGKEFRFFSREDLIFHIQLHT